MKKELHHLSNMAFRLKEILRLARQQKELTPALHKDLESTIEGINKYWTNLNTLPPANKSAHEDK